ncbi:hypothetical protein NRIC_32220 [Enterococcus florum]|uniref:J domain-containing protein n=1 Tax=Enterococcus florum TaxID=2480627 RepID=A0A4P5PFY2_9ENTE|nr:hypothetical protein [Enterococcus florum]GCF95331.1 hypothetical protein NRIC_32220 [Enterococcus florum]
MNIWELLEIEKTQEIKQIKKAYAKKLKQIVPDEQPAEFQQLKEAFDRAVELAKGSGQIDQVYPSERRTPVERLEPEETVDDSFMHKVQQFLRECAYFDDLAAWKYLLKDQTSWSIQEFINNTCYIQELLLEHFQFLDKSIIVLLMDTFQLNDLEEELKDDSLVLPYFLHMRQTILSEPEFSFALWRELPVNDRLNYFTYRREYLDLLNQSRDNPLLFKEIEHKVEQIFQQDGDFLVLRAFNQLIKVHGDLDQQDSYQQVSDLLEQASCQPYRSDKLAFFLTTYLRVWKTHELTDRDLELLQKETYLLPATWRPLLMGMLFWKADLPSLVIPQWKKLSKEHYLMIRPFFRKVQRQLDRTEQRELTQNTRYYDPKPYVPPKRKRKISWEILLAICVLLSVFGAFMRYQDRQESRNAFDPKTLQKPPLIDQSNVNELQKKAEETFAAKALISEDADPAQRMIYYFFCQEDQAERQTFINEYVAEEAVPLMQQHLADPAAYPEAKRYDFSFETDRTSTDGLCKAVSYNEENLLIVKLNDEEKIIDVLGTGWHELEPQHYEALLKDINVRPLHSLNFFFSRYLPSEDRKTVVDTYPQYVTEELRTELEKRAADKPVKKYGSGTWQLSEVDGQRYFVINDENDEPAMILTMDNYGRIDHVYLDGWEKMDQKTVKRILDHCEEDKIGIF